MKIDDDEIKKIFEPNPQPTGSVDDLKKIRRDIKQAPKPKFRRRRPVGFWDSILHFAAVSGFSGFIIFILMGWGGFSAEIQWDYFHNYLNNPIPVAVTSPTPTVTPTPTYALTSTPMPLPTLTPELTQTPAILAIGSTAGNYIKIDKISVNAPIIWDVPEADILSQLKNGVAHYQGTAHPGEGGNVFIVGHSSNYPWIKSDYNHIFALLNKLNDGDQIEVQYGSRTFTYTVNDKKIIKPGEIQILQDTPTETLTLMTCWPVGTSLKRLIVQAQLVSSSN